MPFIAQKTIDDVNNRLDAVGIIGEYVRLEQRGANWWGLCPFHNEKTPSFSVNPDRKSYYCFGCHEGGGVINFVMQIEKAGFPEALTMLAKKLGVQIEYESGGMPDKEGDDAAQLKNDIAELYRRVAGSFHHILMTTDEGKAAKEYALERGLSLEMIERFKLGWAPADRYWLHKFLGAKGYSAPFLAQSGLFSRNYPQAALFSGRLMFPINDRQGRSAAFGGRILAGDGPKYLNSPESPVYRKRETLFAMDAALPEIRRSKTVYLCEGYMDVIALHQAGVTNAVAPLGTSFTAEQARLLRRWADTINLLFDTDAAGQTAAEKAILTCRTNAVPCAVTRVELPGGAPFKDPADILHDAGAEALAAAVRRTQTDSDYLIAKAAGAFVSRRGDSQGIARAVAALVPFFNSVETETEKAAFAREAALALGADGAAVLSDLRAGGAKAPAPLRRRETDAHPVMMNEELWVLCAAAVHFEARPDLFSAVRQNFSAEEFDDRAARELYFALEECLREGDARLDALLDRLDGTLREFVAEKCAAREFSGNAEALVFDGIRGLKIKRLQRRGCALDIELRLAKNECRPTGDLLLEKQFVLDELKSLKGG